VKLTKLRTWREVSGLSQEELGRRAGLTHSGISRIEAGSGCHPTTARRLAAALDLRVVDLVEDPPQRVDV
jgi:transcriptional regulator with XRE-family HTH domain